MTKDPGKGKAISKLLEQSACMLTKMKVSKYKSLVTACLGLFNVGKASESSRMAKARCCLEYCKELSLQCRAVAGKSQAVVKHV